MQETAAVYAPPDDKLFTQEASTHQWQAYIGQMPTEERAMSMRMKVMMPRMISETTFEVVANNTQIGQALRKMEKDILAHLRHTLANNSIQMEVRVAEAQEVKHITSKPALFQKMAEKNQNVRRLAELLKLEIC